jgi:hypothetical protein
VANGDWRNKNFLEGSASALPKNFFGASGDAPFGFSACFSLASFS